MAEREVRNKQRRYILPDIQVPLRHLRDNEDVKDLFEHPALSLGSPHHRNNYLKRLRFYGDRDRQISSSIEKSSLATTSVTSMNNEVSYELNTIDLKACMLLVSGFIM